MGSKVQLCRWLGLWKLLGKVSLDLGGGHGLRRVSGPLLFSSHNVFLFQSMCFILFVCLFFGLPTHWLPLLADSSCSLIILLP